VLFEGLELLFRSVDIKPGPKELPSKQVPFLISVLTSLNFIATTEIPAISRIGEKFNGYDLSGPYE
jgi:hypothetical protein